MESGMLLRTNVYAVYATRETKDTATIRALDEVPSAKTFVSLSKSYWYTYTDSVGDQWSSMLL